MGVEPLFSLYACPLVVVECLWLVDLVEFDLKLVEFRVFIFPCRAWYCFYIEFVLFF